MQMLWQDVRHGMRMLTTSPGFTILAVLTLALGIGANTAIFSVVNAVLLRPLPYRDPASLVNVWGRLDKEGIPQLAISEPEYWDLLDRNESFSEIAVYSLGGTANLAREDARPVQVTKARASASLFHLLSTTPALGRTFSADEDQPGRSHVVVVSYEMWHSQFGGSLDILTKSVRLDGESYSVVGVLPRQFSVGGRSDVWIPLALDRAKPDDRGSHYLHLVARLKPAVTFSQASASLKKFADDLRRAYPNNYATGGTTTSASTWYR